MVASANLYLQRVRQIPPPVCGRPSENPDFQRPGCYFLQQKGSCPAAHQAITIYSRKVLFYGYWMLEAHRKITIFSGKKPICGYVYAKYISANLSNTSNRGYFDLPGEQRISAFISYDLDYGYFPHHYKAIDIREKRKLRSGMPMSKQRISKARISRILQGGP